MKLVILLLLPLGCFAQITLDKKITLGNKVELLVPGLLKEMTEDNWVIKYHQAKRPAVVLTDENAEVNLMIDTTMQPAGEDNLEEYKNFRKENLRKTRTDVEFLQDSVVTVNGKKMAYIKFMSQAIDTKIFNYYFFTVANGRIVFFGFNCMEKLKDEWEKIADAMMASVKTY